MNKILSLVLTAGIAIPFSGCAMLGIGGRDSSLSTSPKLPAAEGKAAFRKTKNDNTRLELKVRHLAKPEKLNPPANIYVVWTRASKEAAAQNIGALKVDDDLNGELETETPLHDFELFVTAETNGQAQQPSGEPLLWTSYSR